MGDKTGISPGMGTAKLFPLVCTALHRLPCAPVDPGYKRVTRRWRQFAGVLSLPFQQCKFDIFKLGDSSQKYELWMKCQKIGEYWSPQMLLTMVCGSRGSSLRGQGCPLSRLHHLPALLKCHPLCSFIHMSLSSPWDIWFHYRCFRFRLWSQQFPLGRNIWSCISHLYFVGNISDLFLRTERKRCFL